MVTIINIAYCFISCLQEKCFIYKSYYLICNCPQDKVGIFHRIICTNCQGIDIRLFFYIKYFNFYSIIDLCNLSSVQSGYLFYSIIFNLYTSNRPQTNAFFTFLFCIVTVHRTVIILHSIILDIMFNLYNQTVYRIFCIEYYIMCIVKLFRGLELGISFPLLAKLLPCAGSILSI